MQDSGVQIRAAVGEWEGGGGTRPVSSSAAAAAPLFRPHGRTCSSGDGLTILPRGAGSFPSIDSPATPVAAPIRSDPLVPRAPRSHSRRAAPPSAPLAPDPAAAAAAAAAAAVGPRAPRSPALGGGRRRRWRSWWWKCGAPTAPSTRHL